MENKKMSVLVVEAGKKAEQGSAVTVSFIYKEEIQ